MHTNTQRNQKPCEKLFADMPVSLQNADYEDQFFLVIQKKYCAAASQKRMKHSRKGECSLGIPSELHSNLIAYGVSQTP